MRRFLQMFAIHPAFALVLLSVIMPGGVPPACG
jgi:hypothetical protein